MQNFYCCNSSSLFTVSVLIHKYSRVGITQTSFPLPEFIIAAGFFLVLIVERIVLNCREMRASREDREPLLPEARNHGHGHGAIAEMESSGHHVHVDFQAHSSFRSFMLFLSLSLHSVFEGLAIGLQSTESKVRAHKTLTAYDAKLCLHCQSTNHCGACWWVN